MASWDDLVNYVRSRYRVEEESDGLVRLVFELGDRRTQTVMLWRMMLPGAEEWVQIESPIGDVVAVDLDRAIDRIGRTVCGGMGKAGDLVTFRHAVPLANLDPNELERPLELVTATADDLERTLLGGDTF